MNQKSRSLAIPVIYFWEKISNFFAPIILEIPCSSGMAKPHLFQPLNVALAIYVVFIISNIAQELMPINAPKEDLHLNFGYKIREFKL